MTRPLACVFVLVTTACGGQGEGEPTLPAGGPGDVPQAQVTPRVADDRDESQGSPDTQSASDDVAQPEPSEDPVLIAGGSRPAPPAGEPAPAGDDATRAITRAITRAEVESWQARAPERYVIRTCGTGFAPPSCSLAAVEAGRVVSLSNRFLPDEPWVSASSDDAQDPIAALFESAASAPEGCKTSVQRDPVYAFPSRIYFDCGEEGWGLSVACFKPNTLDASVCQ